MDSVQPENTENNTPASEAGAVPVISDEPTRRDLNDPKATFEDLPYKPQLTEKQAKRANQTLKGMIISVAFCIAVFIPLYLLNPTPDEKAFESTVDLQATAQGASEMAGTELFAPELADDEYANFARWQANTAQGVPYWEFGVVIEDSKFVWVRQAVDSNPTWVALITDSALPTGTKEIDGVQWEVRTKDAKTYLISEGKDTTFVLSSDTGEEELVEMARLASQDAK